MHTSDHNQSALTLHLPDEAATIALGQTLAPLVEGSMVIYLEGDLGAGKTTLVRALLRALGHQGPVKSPTYTLVEVYKLSSLYLYHFDFYRFNDPEEFVDAGLDDYFRQGAACLVEWPDKAGAYVPAADLRLVFRFRADGGREVDLLPGSPGGALCLKCLNTQSSILPPA